MGRLTEANYLSRRVKLAQHVQAATAAHLDAAFRLEIGEGDEAGAKAAKDHLDGFTARLAGLDAAWTRELSQQADERRDANDASRKQIATDFMGLLDQRQQAAAKVQRSLKSLLDGLDALSTAESGAAELLTGGRHLGVSGSVETLTNAMYSLRHQWCDGHIAGAMMSRGYDLSSLNWATSAWQLGQDTASIADMCERANRAAIAQASREYPDIGNLAFAAEEEPQAA